MPMIQAPIPPSPAPSPAHQASTPTSPQKQPARRQSQHSDIARSALMNRRASLELCKPPPTSAPREHALKRLSKDGVGAALTDTPLPTAPNSPRIPPNRQNSASSTPRIRPTTLDIPGLTKSKVSPDGKIAQRDVGSKLIIVMVGLPARGKSYITKKMTRYLNWLQHDTKIFNVGERRRVAAGALETPASAEPIQPERIAAEILMNGPPTPDSHSQHQIPTLNLPDSATAAANGSIGVIGVPPSPRPSPAASEDESHLDVQIPALDPPKAAQDQTQSPPSHSMDQSANFFDPANRRAALIREKAAMDTLDDLLDYILNKGGSVGIFDATNSTMERRKWVMDMIRQKAGPDINVLFIESVCKNENILESNMRLKLSGPDYKGMDPVKALEDFKKRVAIYEKNYVPLGDYEEEHNMPYVKIIDVGRKIITHQLNGFLSGQAVYYLLNFNLAPRQIWITRHGESEDNVAGKIGGDSDLTANGRKYGEALAKFLDYQKKEWEIKQRDKAANTHWPPHPGDHTPPNPYYSAELGDPPPKNFCVWTSMLKRSVQSAEPFEQYEDDFEVKQMRMLDELYAGEMEGMTYEEIRTKHADEFERRKHDKMQYRYPGPGGEGYLDVIHRLRPVIVELERMTDHCLLITHRSVARVLLAYFKGLKRDDVADLDCPLGMLYMLEPKPYGVEFKAYKYNADKDWFDEQPNFELRRSSNYH
ncbi:bifunctional 6-phosphofructo-2-kinase/fructose-2,6-bisphosphate 2-phosphatase [Rhizodiscina lignyota]|uniref:Bifunctional 6-phosphofructo-2-kinase/fructose-2,6-bisphosphate 2-phosphatase n=1 Tax=Rhizodiscina lignyota TaxID=1504668 RepID=A0A9P4I714_9PEZI|nr:bifunctional 6-phosphofructo-2-kinase/fructose-2,6-bisphosphate 2-phosphatase [Rhizodiscina lignyota]